VLPHNSSSREEIETDSDPCLLAVLLTNGDLDVYSSIREVLSVLMVRTWPYVFLIFILLLVSLAELVSLLR